MAGILPTSWAGPNRTLPATFQISPDQMARILEMHRESHSNALTYILIVLFLYVLALAIMVARYLRSEDPNALRRIASTLRRCIYRRRTNSNDAITTTVNDMPTDKSRAPNNSSAPQQMLSVAPMVTLASLPSPIVTVTLREVQDTMV